jgi:hypothetical protein
MGADSDPSRNSESPVSVPWIETERRRTEISDDHVGVSVPVEIAGDNPEGL